MCMRSKGLSKVISHASKIAFSKITLKLTITEDLSIAYVQAVFLAYHYKEHQIGVMNTLLFDTFLDLNSVLLVLIYIYMTMNLQVYGFLSQEPTKYIAMHLLHSSGVYGF